MDGTAEIEYVKDFVAGEGGFSIITAGGIYGDTFKVGAIYVPGNQGIRFLVTTKKGEKIHPSSKEDIEILRREFLSGESTIHVSEHPTIGFHDSEMFKAENGEIKYAGHDSGF
ncbi:MAG: hypothetical protein WA139_03925 [Candidatus Aenigmatarchaeota archaeon]